MAASHAGACAGAEDDRKAEAGDGEGSGEGQTVAVSMEHVHFREFDEVYEPAEDSFLLTDAVSLRAEREWMRGLRAPTVLEVGCGSGYVVAHVALLLRQLSSGGCGACWATDVNSAALAMAQRMLRENGLSPLLLVQMDLASAFGPPRTGPFDLVLFNPPYVPTPDDEVGVPDISAAWAGGQDGRRVIDRFIPHVSGLLSPQGRLYMVVVEENKPGEIIARFAEHGLHAEVRFHTSSRLAC